jgi:hypothetical protein
VFIQATALLNRIYPVVSCHPHSCGDQSAMNSNPRDGATSAYLVRCNACDRAFWLPTRDDVPEHSGWERRASAHHDTGVRCAGSAMPGYWIGEGDGHTTIVDRSGPPETFDRIDGEGHGPIGDSWPSGKGT